MLSDEAAMANWFSWLAALCFVRMLKIKTEGVRSLYGEPVHGSAPDIAGKNMANPIATILKFFHGFKILF